MSLTKGICTLADVIIRGGLSYTAKVARYGPIAHWVQGDAEGATAVEQVNSPAQDGTYTSVTLGQPGIGDGNTCPLFSGQPTFNHIYSAAFSSVFNGHAGTVLAWIKVYDSTVWTDGQDRYVFRIRGNGAGPNMVMLNKSASGNMIAYLRAGGVNKNKAIVTTTTAFVPIVMAWNEADDVYRVYLDGAQVGGDITGLGTWGGTALVSTETAISTSYIVDGRSPWHGWIAHLAVWDFALTPVQVADLAVI